MRTSSGQAQEAGPQGLEVPRKGRLSGRWFRRKQSMVKELLEISAIFRSGIQSEALG